MTNKKGEHAELEEVDGNIQYTFRIFDSSFPQSFVHLGNLPGP